MKPIMFYVYRANNRNKKEVYHGVSEKSIKKINKSNCIRDTLAIKHWNFDEDRIMWKDISSHISQKAALKKAKRLETSYRFYKSGYKNIKINGI